MEIFIKQVVLKVLQNSHKNISTGVFLDKVASWSPATLLKKIGSHSCFSVNFVGTYFVEHLWLLKMEASRVTTRSGTPRKFDFFFVQQSYILVITFPHFLVILLRSESPQVKRYLISSLTNLVHELPHELRTQDLRKLENIRKISNVGGDAPQCSLLLPEIKR